MKIAGFLVVGKGEADRYLPQVLKRLDGLCDRIFIWGNNPDKKTDELCSKYDYYRHPEDLWGTQQWRIKFTLLTEFVKPYNPDWIVCVDADEILDKRLTREKAEEMADWGEVAFNFYCVQLWNSENTMRVDGYWGNFWNVRYYKFIPELQQFFQKTALHCGLAPIYAYKWATPSGLLFKHYGYLKPEDRAKKADRYERYDPTAIYKSIEFYKSIKDINPVLEPFDEDEFGKKLKYVPKKPLINKVLKERLMRGKNYVVKNPHGRIVECNELVYETIKNKPGFVLITDYEAERRNVIEAPLIKSDKGGLFECPICGKQFENKKKLQGHKIGAHK